MKQVVAVLLQVRQFELQGRAVELFVPSSKYPSKGTHLPLTKTLKSRVALQVRQEAEEFVMLQV